MELNRHIESYNSTTKSTKIASIKEEKHICGVRYGLVSWKGLTELNDTWIRVSLLDQEIKKKSNLTQRILYRKNMRKMHENLWLILHIRILIVLILISKKFRI